MEKEARTATLTNPVDPVDPADSLSGICLPVAYRERNPRDFPGRPTKPINRKTLMTIAKTGFTLARPEGFEPPTLGFEDITLRSEKTFYFFNLALIASEVAGLMAGLLPRASAKVCKAPASSSSKTCAYLAVVLISEWFSTFETSFRFWVWRSSFVAVSWRTSWKRKPFTPDRLI